MSVLDNLNRIKSCKENIKQAIINKGVDMEGVAFEGYADKINEISGGGSTDDTEYIEFDKAVHYEIMWAAPSCIQMKFATPDVEYSNDPNTGNSTWSGEGHLLTIAIYSPNNSSLYTGTYTANAGNNQVSAGQFNIGGDVDMGGWMYNAGTYFDILPGLLNTPTNITDGTIDVSISGDNLVIKLKSSVINARFTGLLSACPFEVKVYDPTDYLTVRKSLTSYSSDERDITGGAFCYMNITDVSLPNVQHMPEDVFKGCNKLVSVNIPNATGVGGEAFQDCSELTAIDLPYATYVNPRSFSGCNKLASVNIPECTQVSENAFANCSALPSINIPKCEFIGPYAFQNCGVLASITATACKEIYDFTFSNTALTSIDIPNCNRIGVYAFNWCPNLTLVSAPNCAEIVSCAFQGCSALTELDLSNVYYCTIPDTSVFDMTPFANGEGTIKVHSSSLAYYQSTYPWSEFAGCLVGAGDPDVVLLANDNGRIYGETSILTNDYLGFLAIGNDAVISIDLPNVSKAPSIQSYPNLQSVNLGKLIQVNNMMFSDNTALTTVNLPECTYVDMNGFMNCTALETVNLPKCTVLGDTAFANCNNLKTLTIGTEYNDGYTSNWNCPLPESIEAIFVNPIFVDAYKSDWFWGQYADKIFAEGSDPNAPVVVKSDWYVIGNFNGGTAQDPNTQMIIENDWNVLRNLTVDGQWLKFVKGLWEDLRGGEFTAVGEAVSLTAEGSDIIVPAGTYDVYLNSQLDTAYFMEVGQTPF